MTKDFLDKRTARQKDADQILKRINAMENDPLPIVTRYYCDNKRHLVCVPYSIERLHYMAMYFKLGRHWFHKTHYDIPKMRIAEITACCAVVSPKDIVRIIKTGEHPQRILAAETADFGEHRKEVMLELTAGEEIKPGEPVYIEKQKVFKSN